MRKYERRLKIATVSVTVQKCGTPAERRVKDARFPVTKTIDTFDFKAQPSINEPLVRDLLRGEFIEKRENVLIIGNSRTCKTHLACALAFSACMQGHQVRFSTVTGLVTELPECREDRTLQRFQKQLKRQQLLVLDELGYVPFCKAAEACCWATQIFMQPTGCSLASKALYIE